MLQSSMRRFLLLLTLAAFLPGASAWAQSPVVAHGLIIQLKPSHGQASNSHELPSVVQARRDSVAQERMAAVRQGAGVASFSHRHLSGEHRLMRFAQPLQGPALEDTMRRLRLHPDVAWVEPNVRLKPQAIPNDTNFALQWHLGSSALATSIAALNMTRTWSITTGTAITVAVVDTGVRYGHPDLADKILPGYDFIEDVVNANDGNGRDADASDPGDWVTSNERSSLTFAGCDESESTWHGTFIAGQIAAISNNAVGVTGMNWNARILPVRVSGKCGALLSDILDGMRWAAGLPVSGVPSNPYPARVVNLSFGGDQPCSSSYQSVIDEMASVGALLVVAAGNSLGAGDNMQLKRPADCRGVMSVGAVQSNGLKTSYSNVGANMAFMTTGGHGNSTSTMLLSSDNAGLTKPGADNYGYKQGTSFSAPLAAGVASLMLAINPALTPDALIARMKASSLPHVTSMNVSCSSNAAVACTCNTSVCGAGLLNPAGAVLQSFNPAAVIAAVGTPSSGGSVVLDGRASTAVGTPTLASYTWSQIGGTPVSLPNVNASVTQVVLPDTPGIFIFQLRVRDTLARSGDAQLYINVESTALSVSSPSGLGSGGGGADRWFSLLLLAVLVVGALGRFSKKLRR